MCATVGKAFRSVKNFSRQGSSDHCSPRKRGEKGVGSSERFDDRGLVGSMGRWEARRKPTEHRLSGRYCQLHAWSKTASNQSLFERHSCLGPVFDDAYVTAAMSHLLMPFPRSFGVDKWVVYQSFWFQVHWFCVCLLVVAIGRLHMS